MNSPALILVDLQEDFLDRAGLLPLRHELTARVARLLNGCRELGVPVLHVQTHVQPDGRNRMPHWERTDRWSCVVGTQGVKAPTALEPLATEAILAKRFYSAFDARDLATKLAEIGAKTLVIAGVYLQACVRASALDAYARGYEVWIAGDAVGYTEPAHAELTREHLAQRAARFADVDEILACLGDRTNRPAAHPTSVPVACIGGRWREAYGGRRYWHRQPSDLRRTLACVPLADRECVAEAAAVAATAQTEWGQRPAAERGRLLRAFAEGLVGAAAPLAELVIQEVGKPRAAALAEVERATAHVETALALLDEGDVQCLAGDANRSVRYRPVGCAGLVTPWNNPVGIPVGKLAPALAFGNSVVWKPAPQAPRTSIAVMKCLLEAGVPGGVVSLVFGDADTARQMFAEPFIAAISLTGSTASGHTAAALCAQHGKRLQAELGGNNPVIVLADCDLAETATGVARDCFGFAGQRCTAARRILVERAILEPFTRVLVEAVSRLEVGDPRSSTCDVGPLISASHRERVSAGVVRAQDEGGHVLCGGGIPDVPVFGCYYEPTLVTGLDPGAALVREESFGPVAVILPIDDLEDGIRLANDTQYGLLATVCTRDASTRQRFADAIEAGMIKFEAGPLAVDAAAPFAAWKASGIGPPEHGAWDREFYTRPQAVYAAPAPTFEDSEP